MPMYVDRVGVGEYFYIHTMSETLSYKVYDQSIIYPDETEILEIQPGKRFSNTDYMPSIRSKHAKVTNTW